MRSSEHTPGGTEQERLLPLVAQQSLTAERVMEAVGHTVGLWHVPAHHGAIMSLECRMCDAAASIELIDGPAGAGYTVLLMPSGDCPHRRRRSDEERIRG